MAASDEIESALAAIDPAALDYGSWLEVGMALKAAGFDCSTWEEWSRLDGRYHPGECERKWRSFKGEGITELTVFKLARDGGWRGMPSDGDALDWHSSVTACDGPAKAPPPVAHPKAAPVTAAVVTAGDVGSDPVPEGPPKDWRSEVCAYLEAVFEPNEHVGFVTSDVRRDDNGKWKPCGAGDYWKTCAEVCEALRRRSKRDGKQPATLGETGCMGDPVPEAGAYVRINPLDGKGGSDANVTTYRHALVESDTLEPGKQLALIRAMRLPVSAVVASGGKSVHAVVRVDARDEREYRERVGALYEFCAKSGFDCDVQNRNPSRLSRLPGVQRGERWQRLVKVDWDPPKTWDAWQAWVAEEAAGLPPIEGMGEMSELPELAPELIHGFMRVGQKGMLTGPSKAGKSFALIQLAVAACMGWEWLGFKCEPGKVLYINLEIQRASFAHRVADVYAAMADARGAAHGGVCDLADLDVWNLRGHSAPLDALVPLIVGKARGRGYSLVIVDPIYKVLTGDENSASDMGHFTNQFDVICNELGCSVVYAHHHAKGAAGDRAAVDRGSGSGVFARDPDAMVDMSELDVPAERRGELEYMQEVDGTLRERHASAYRLEFTLRDFESPLPRDVLFRYPLHVETDALRDCALLGTNRAAGIRGGAVRAGKADDEWQRKNNLIANALDELAAHGRKPTTGAVWGVIESRFAPAVGDLKWSREAFANALKPSRSGSAGKRCAYVKRANAAGEYEVVTKGSR